MGMTDNQFKAFLRQLLRRLELAYKITPSEELRIIIEDIQTELEA